MYCLRLFIVVLQELHCLLQCYDCGVFIEKYVYTKFCLDWLLRERVTWPYMSLS